MSTNSRVTCEHCGKDMVPRIISGPPTIRSSTNWTPIPRYSVCPFCGQEHERFSQANFSASMQTLWGGIIALVCLVLVLNTCSHSPEKADSAAITPLATSSQLLARDPPLNAAAFGIEVGYANLAGLVQKFPKIQSALSKATQDGEYSVFVVDGNLFDLELLRRVKFTIRTDNQIIVSINLVMKEGSSEMIETLTAKYPLIANIKEYSPDRHLLLGKGDSLVEILANYVPSTLEVRYQTTAFYEVLQQQKIDAKIEREAKRDRQL